jgi:hypothetical protein
LVCPVERIYHCFDPCVDFRHAAFVEPVTKAQALWQETRGEHIPGHVIYPNKTAAAVAAAAKDDPEDETTKPPYEKLQQLQYRSYAVRKWKTIEHGPELFGES